MKVLFVDDEPQILRALKRLFFKASFITLFAGSGQEGVNVLRDNPDIQLVVSDIMMPEMDGIAFLTIVKKEFPGAFRCALSGFLDKDLVIQALVDGIVHFYMAKPWKNEDLKKKIDGILQLGKMINHQEAVDYDSVYNAQLPKFPEIYNQVSEMILREAEMEDIAREIEKDPSLVINVLKICNSAFYDLKINNIHRALVFLGLNTMKSLLLADHFSRFIPDYSDLKLLIDHTWKTNSMFRSIFYDLTGHRVKDKFSSLGILSGVGLLVGGFIFPSEYQSIISDLKSDPALSIIEREESFFNAHYGFVGSHLLKTWGFDFDLIELCVYFLSNTPSYRGEYPQVLWILKLADQLAWNQLDLSVVDIDTALYEKYLQISRKRIDDVIEEATHG